MSSLEEIKEKLPSDRQFRNARNVIMMNMLITNGQRTGAIRNMTCGEFRAAREEGSKVIIPVSSHKTAGSFVCQLVLDQSLKSELDVWFKARNRFLMATLCHTASSDEDFLFCGNNGKQLASNELARIARSGVGGTVIDMRKAQYHLVSCIFIAF